MDWGDVIDSKPKKQQSTIGKKAPPKEDNDWDDEESKPNDNRVSLTSKGGNQNLKKSQESDGGGINLMAKKPGNMNPKSQIGMGQGNMQNRLNQGGPKLLTAPQSKGPVKPTFNSNDDDDLVEIGKDDDDDIGFGGMKGNKNNKRVSQDKKKANDDDDGWGDDGDDDDKPKKKAGKYGKRGGAGKRDDFDFGDPSPPRDRKRPDVKNEKKDDDDDWF